MMKSRRIVVLGATGFVGSHTVEAAHSAGFETLSLGSAELNLLDPSTVDQLASMLSPHDILVHSAAIAPSKTSQDVIANLTMTKHVMDCLEAKGLAQLIVVSSDAVYGGASGVINENSPCNPDSLHGVMSLARELICASADVETLTICRPAPIYGFGDTHNSYGPNRFAREALTDGKISIFGAGEAKRDHVDIRDVADVIVRCARNSRPGILNIASGASLSFATVGTMVADAVEYSAEVQSVGTEGQPTYRSFDTTRLVESFPDFISTHPEVGFTRMIELMTGSI